MVCNISDYLLDIGQHLIIHEPDNDDIQLAEIFSPDFIVSSLKFRKMVVPIKFDG